MKVDLMRSQGIIDDVEKFLKIFYDQLDRCPYRCFVNNRVYCSKKDCFIRSDNECGGCPELPAPIATKEMTLDEYNDRIKSDEEFHVVMKEMIKIIKELEKKVIKNGRK